jgi:excisionase family DNA binding protein
MTVVARVTLTKAEAAEALGISLDHFERHVRPHLRVIRCGRRVLIRLGELQRWAQEQEAFALAGDSE